MQELTICCTVFMFAGSMPAKARLRREHRVASQPSLPGDYQDLPCLRRKRGAFRTIHGFMFQPISVVIRFEAGGYFPLINVPWSL
jgi:hypothetical protein